jgi:hypothetical protein
MSHQLSRVDQAVHALVREHVDRLTLVAERVRDRADQLRAQ